MNDVEHKGFNIGDEVTLYHDLYGCIVCNISDGLYSENFPKDEWEYLEEGVMIMTDEIGLIHTSIDSLKKRKR